MEDVAQEVEQDLGREDRGDSGRIIGRRHFHQIDADDVAAPGNALQQLHDLPIEEAAVAGRARAGRDRGVERVDVDRDVVARTFGDQLQHALGAELAALAHRADLRAAPARILVALARGRGDVADAELGQPGDVGLLRGAAHRVAMALAHAVPHVDEIQMRVDLDQVDRWLVAEGTHAGDVDRMVAAQDHRHGAALEDLADRRLRVAVAGGGVGMHDVGVAHIDDPDLVGGQIDRVVLVVVGAAMAEREQGRGLADPRGPKRAPARYCVPMS